MISKPIVRWAKYLGVLALLIPNFLYSTGIILSTDNLEEVMEELNYLHDEEISISMNDVKNFLKMNSAGGIDTSLPLTQGFTDFHNDQSITLSWDEVPEIDKHEVRYINLKTGNIGNGVTGKNSINFNLKNGLYLFTFQSQAGGNKGPSWIIIEDKPLAFGSDAADCRCAVPQFHPNQSIPLNGQLLYPIEATLSEKFIAIHTKYAVGNSQLLVAQFVVRLRANEDGLYEVTLAQGEPGGEACLLNTDTDNSFIYTLSPFISPGSLTHDKVVKFVFNPEGIYFRGLTEDVSGYSFVTECDTPPKQLEKPMVQTRTPQKTQPYPNPTSGLFTISINSAIDSSAEILIKNSMGQNLKRVTTDIDLSTISLDISDYPNDIYYLEIIQDDKREVFPIVKLE